MTPSGSWESTYANASGTGTGTSSPGLGGSFGGSGVVSVSGGGTGASTPRTNMTRSSSVGYVVGPDGQPVYEAGGGGGGGEKKRKKMLRKSWGNKKVDFDFNINAKAANDIVGIVMVEILGATDLPKLKNSTFPVLLTLAVLFSRKMMLLLTLVLCV